MAVHLLDVNLLVALSRREHVLHRPAQRWFAEIGVDGWATTTVTESGFVRVSMNPLVTDRTVSWRAALEMLGAMRATRGHRWWDTDVDLLASPVARRAPISGHRQVSDVHLAALAARHGGLVATFDRGLVEVLAPQDRDVVHLVPTS